MWRSADFWVAIAVALLVRIRTSRGLRPWQVLTSAAIAVGAAWVATPLLVARTWLDVPVSAALIALTAEGLMRRVLIALDDPRQAIALWRAWRGK